MRKALMMIATVMLMCGCIESHEGVDLAVATKRVTFDVSNDEWNVVTRTLEADGVEMTDLWLFDYNEGVLVRTLHKSQGDVDFDSPTMLMDYGEHHVYMVASRGKTPSVDGTEITWATPSDTFWKDVAVTVSDGSSSNVAVTLDRVATKMRVTVTDEVPAGVANLVITPGIWWYGLDYTTGAAIESRNNERSITVPSSYIGTAGQLTVNIFGMSDSDEWVTDVSIAAKNADGDVLGSVALDDVPFLRNRVTEASGNLFGSNRTFTVSLDEQWLDSHVIEW
jgi:hypothetical protein